MNHKIEQKFVDSVGGSEVLNKIIEHNSLTNQNKLTFALSNEEILLENKHRRENKELEWSKERTMRSIIEMPTEIALQVEKLYPGFFKDKKIMKDAIKKDSLLQQYLTVPLSSI